ncbi:hypothetical protein RB195_017553 [Necator americanus]|uniref:Apple domain-containing protein n=1 Tax=Necator americanus TaxID=51031 RepID=A0ABR1C6S1_NECAM
MRSEDDCLQFCRDTATRCRSVVYDTVQHICHFFLDEGHDVTAPAARMTYLRVVSEDCLVGAPSSSEANVIESNESQESLQGPVQSPSQFVVSTTPFYRPETTAEPRTELTTEEVTTEEVTPEATEESPSSTTTTIPSVNDDEDNFKVSGKQSDNEQKLGGYEVMRDIDAVESSDKRWQSSMEQLTKNKDHMAFRGEKMSPTEDVMESERPRSTLSLISRGQKVHLNKELNQKLDQLKRKFPNRYAQYLAEKNPSSFPISAEEKFSAKRINFSDDNIFARKERTEGGDVRRRERKKLKQVVLHGSHSFLNKALDFLEQINGKKEFIGDDSDSQVDNSAAVSALTKGCFSGYIPLWVSFENSAGSEMIDSSYVEDFEACKDLCADETCTSLTFFDDKQCMVNVEDGGVHLRRPAHGRRSARTDLKFCYPDKIHSYHDCSTFVGFREFALTVEPREQFDGLPPGYDGLKLCIELCVLSTQYRCRSATYLTLEGRCSLSEMDANTAPSKFERSDVVGQLYFENGCTAYSNQAQIDKNTISIERMKLKRKPTPIRPLKIKPIKLRKNEEKGQYNYKCKKKT